MSRFWPHTELAEDQPYPVTILTTHVLYRGFQAGALGGAVLSPAFLLYRRRQAAQAAGAAVTAARPTLAPILLRSSGVGALVGVGLLTVALQQRMKGREPIEWSDRSWRLLENEGQVLTDDFSVAGAVAGVASGFRQGALQVGWRGPIARAGLGSLAGTAAYMVFQYGMRPAFSKK